MTKKNEKLVTVFTSYRKEIFYIAISILDGSGIKYFTLNEYLDQAYGADSYIIQVAESDVQTAKELLKDISEDRELSVAEKREDEAKYFRIITFIVLIILFIIFAVFVVKC